MKQCKQNIIITYCSVKMYTSKTLNQSYRFSRIKTSFITNMLLNMVPTINQTMNIMT